VNTIDLNIDSRGYATLKRLIRLINLLNGKPGDRLPAQSVLCKRLGANNTAVSAAMECLVQTGVLTRRRRVGTVIQDLTAVPRLQWNVALLLPRPSGPGQFNYFSDLGSRVQAAIIRSGCRCFAYYVGGYRSAYPGLSDFPELENDIPQIDGIVTLMPIRLPDVERLEKKNLPVAHLPLWDQMPRAVLTDRRALASDAIRNLFDAGCRKFLVASPMNESGAVWRAIVATLSEVGLPNDAVELANCQPGLVPGARLAHELIKRSRTNRPDGVIAFDDYTMMGFTQILARNDSKKQYDPVLACLTTLQFPAMFARPVMHFEMDNDVLTQRLTDMLMPLLENPAIEPQHHWVVPTHTDGPVDQAAELSAMALASD